MTETLPPNTGFVAAAYVVFVALLLIYVVVMSIRASRLERQLSELLEEGDVKAKVVEEEVVVETATTEAGS
ncbi:MAG: hypothetical protein FGM34_10530 [Solirubrobacteraceae bacterium]|nr:hypothetical protein [Solirubrobacteraceae bacterium]